MGKKQRRGGASKGHKKQARDRPWLLPVLVFVGALVVFGLVLVAASDK